MLIQYYQAAMIAVKKAAVLGAGTMGAQIAAHPDRGIPMLLLEIAPSDKM
jgi:3-hydroxyacyl-CoA dehydrogenase